MRRSRAAPSTVFALRLQLSGSLTARIGESDVEAREGDLLFLDMKQAFDLTLAADENNAADVTLWVSRRKMLAAASRDDAPHGFLVSGASPAGALIAGCLRLLVNQAKAISAEEMDALCDGVFVLIAKALAPEFARLKESDARRNASFVIIRRYIDQHLALTSLNAESLAKRFEISRASLYRLFEPVGGVAGYIRKARLDHAYQELMANENASCRIGPIAYSLGFRNVSAFNRLFKAHYGVSPRGARKRTMAFAPTFPAPAMPAEGDRDTLAYLLARLGRPDRHSNFRELMGWAASDDIERANVDFPPRTDPCSTCPLWPERGSTGVIVIRRRRFRQHYSIRQIARRTGLSRNKVRKCLRSVPGGFLRADVGGFRSVRLCHKRASR